MLVSKVSHLLQLAKIIEQFQLCLKLHKFIKNVSNVLKTCLELENYFE